MNDPVVNKIQSIHRCIRRAREEYSSDREGFASNFTRQDAAILNVVRACETAIDLANHVIRLYKLGIPVSSADTFRLLHAEGVVDTRLAERMEKMVGFRNTVVHQYTAIDISIVKAVISNDLDELVTFAEQVRRFVNARSPK